jgi:hypothetical protein
VIDVRLPSLVVGGAAADSAVVDDDDVGCLLDDEAAAAAATAARLLLSLDVSASCFDARFDSRSSVACRLELELRFAQHDRGSQTTMTFELYEVCVHRDSP